MSEEHNTHALETFAPPHKIQELSQENTQSTSHSLLALPRYRVDTNEFMIPFPEGWSIRSTVWSIVLGEREDDSFLVINLSGKAVQYNLISKTLHEIFDMRSNQVADDYHDGFIMPFAIYDMGSKIVDHKVYEFIPSSASV
ncbi:hypothetical protein Tco_0787337 [Tanacetum coccineum]